LFFSCNNSKEELKLPILITASYDTIHKINSKDMVSSELYVYGINIKDTLDFSVKRHFTDKDNTKNFTRKELKNDSLILIVDDKVNTKFHSSEILFAERLPNPPPPPSENSSENYLDSIFNVRTKQHLDFIKKREKTHYQTYPLFIYNSSNSDREVFYSLLYGELDIILEAENKEGKWMPIEYREIGRICGARINNFKLKPKHYLVSAVRKYSGDYKTKLRAKLLVCDKVIYSNEFNGEINYSQFDSSKVMAEFNKRYSKPEISYYKEKKKLLFLEF